MDTFFIRNVDITPTNLFAIASVGVTSWLRIYVLLCGSLVCNVVFFLTSQPKI